MKNKVTAGFLIVFMGVIIANVGVQCVEAAGNYTDTDYVFDYVGDGCDLGTAARLKMDATSAYAKNLSTHCTHRIAVAGTHSHKDNTPLCYNDCSCNSAGYMVPIGEYRYLPNLVYERGYEYAFLVIMPTLHDPCQVKGKWSPDSI